MKRYVTISVLVLLFSGAGRADEISLEPLDSIDCVEFVGRSVDLEIQSGQLYILDAQEMVVWRLDGDGTVLDSQLIYAGSSDVSNPRDLFFACDDRMFVSDTEAGMLYQYNKSNRTWSAIEMARPCYGDGGDQGYVLNPGQDVNSDTGVVYTSCDGSVLGYACRVEAPGWDAGMISRANHTSQALGADRLAVAHIALGYIQILSYEGNVLYDIQLSGPEVAELRGAYRGSYGATEHSGTYASEYIEDLAQAGASGQDLVPVYIGDIQYYGDRLYVLTNNTIHEYGPDGEMMNRYIVGGEYHGERVLIHDMKIDDRGILYGMDIHHYKRIYRFGRIGSTR